MRNVFSHCFGMLLAVNAATAPATPLPEPGGPVILRVEGRISHTNHGDAAEFDRGMLEALGMRVVETSTPWSEGRSHYEGPLVRALLERVGAEGDELVVTALNDYSALVPVEDFYTYNVILAMKDAERYLPIRDKGPLFIVYPFDSDPALESEVIYNRSVWQIRSIEVR